MQVTTLDACQKAYKGNLAVTANQFCTAVRGGGKGFCRFDGGGASMQGNTVVGVFSVHNGCARVGFPDINTRVAAYVAWILAQAILP